GSDPSLAWVRDVGKRLAGFRGKGLELLELRPDFVHAKEAFFAEPGLPARGRLAHSPNGAPLFPLRGKVARRAAARRMRGDPITACPLIRRLRRHLLPTREG